MNNPPKFPITCELAADLLLENDPLALAIGMLLDQQVLMEKAFKGPWDIMQRLGSLDPALIASMDADKFVERCSEKPAINRFPRSMDIRIQSLCQLVVEDFGGDVSKIWRGQKDAYEVLKRIQKMPGYGPDKSKIFLAILVKRFGYSYEDFEKAAAPFSVKGPVSDADVSDEKSLIELREFKKAKKAAARAKA